MLIKNIDMQQLHIALAELNKKYNDNIQWNNFQYEGYKTYRVTLRVKDSHGKGARLSQYEHPATGRRRHLINACWHVHGDFFDILLAINPKAVIVTARHKIGVNRYGRVAGNWLDWNIGSLMRPLYYSEACEC